MKYKTYLTKEEIIQSITEALLDKDLEYLTCSYNEICYPSKIELVSENLWKKIKNKE
jgi:hypothetical protein